MKPHIVAVERVIPADPQQIFDLLADPSQHPLLDGSHTVQAERPGNPDRLSKGAKFGMDMRIGVPYKILNTVVEFDEPHRIAWRHFGGHRWRYTLSEAEGGTTVCEEWDPTPVPYAWPIYLAMRAPSKNKVGMERTLERLEQHFRG